MNAPWKSPTKPWDQCSPERQRMLRQAWSTGNLRWKLDPVQAEIYDQIYASHGRVGSSFQRQFYMDVSRQNGKDFILSTIGIETMMRNRRICRVAYAAPTKDMVHRAVAPTVQGIFQDCPPDLLPKEIRGGTFLTNARVLTWPWGAKIDLVGVDLHPDWLRGPSTLAILFTEAAFVEDLEGLMQSVILPQLINQQDGFLVFGSTPPDSPGHAWSTKYIPEAKARNMYVKKTIDDNPRISQEHKDALIAEYPGGRKNTRCRRELFCEHIIESTRAAVPEYQDAREVLVTEEGFANPPDYRDCYVALDPGFDHATGAWFGYLDFRTGLFMVEGDFACRFANSREVARHVMAREWQLWGYTPKKPRHFTDQAWQEELEAIKALFYPDTPIAKPVRSWRDNQLKTQTYLRVSDTDSRLIADMSSEHGLIINPVEKDNAESALNNLRLKLQGHKYRIHPRCVNVDSHLSQAVWNKSRTKLAEMPGGGHYDCVPAGVYLNRKIQWGRNPNPPVHVNPQTHFVPSSAPVSGSGRVLSRLFRRPGR